MLKVIGLRLNHLRFWFYPLTLSSLSIIGRDWRLPFYLLDFASLRVFLASSFLTHVVPDEDVKWKVEMYFVIKHTKVRMLMGGGKAEEVM